MSLKFKPYSMIKNAAAGLSVFTMCISPLAQGAAKETQKQLINHYLKDTGLSVKQMTVAEYWKKVRHVYPTSFQKEMDTWVAKKPNVMMPAITATSFKDADGKEQVRLTFSQDGKSFNATFTGDRDNPLKINGVPFSMNELVDPKKINEIHKKLAKYDPNFKKWLGESASTENKSTKNENTKPKSKITFLTYKQFNKLPARKQAEYLIELRLTMEASQKVIEKFYGPEVSLDLQNKYEWVMQFFWGQDAYAKSKSSKKSRSDLTGQTCIVAGYLSIYGENGSCGGDVKGAQDLKKQMEATGASCSSSQVPCNPLVYGFKPSGESFCVSRSPRKTINAATELCNKASPLENNQDKERIIESYMKYKQKKEIDLKIDKDGKVSKEQYAQIGGYLDQLKDLINAADFACENPPLALIKSSARKDQDPACENLKKRSIALNIAAQDDLKTFPIADPVPVVAEKCDQPWQEMRDGQCGCRYGKDGEDGPCLTAAAYTPEEKKKEDSCGSICSFFMSPIVWGIGATAAAMGIAYLLYDKLKGDDKKQTPPVYVPPAPVPDPGTTTTTTTTPPPVQPPPPAPCPEPNTLVNGVCTPPSIVPPPPVAPTGEGGDKTGGPSAAGVR
ncbi:MAG: hypothetical protein ACXVCP_00535 [Bdellovibrio sp.]